MEREELGQIKKEIKEKIEKIKHLQNNCGELSELYVQLEIAKSNYYIALTNLI